LKPGNRFDKLYRISDFCSLKTLFFAEDTIMASFNRVILMGNLTRDVELRYTGSQLAVTDIGLAVNDKRKNQQGEWIEEVTFVDITLWGRTAEIAAEYLTKGAPVLIEGRLKLDSWEKDGKKNYKLKVVGENMRLLGSKGGGGGGRSQGGSGNYDENEYGGGGDHESSGPPPARSSAPSRAPQATQPPPDEIPF
jgi:single-strand DNA-binding protein